MGPVRRLPRRGARIVIDEAAAVAPRPRRPFALPAGAFGRDLLITLIAGALLLAWDATSLDLALIRPWGDAAGFAWRDHWLLRGLLHDGGRSLAWAVMALALVNVWRPWLAGPSRAARAGWLGVTLACLLAVPTIKQFSTTSCPWDLQMFGGVAAHLSHWAWRVSDAGPGRCFPSGHAVAAFAFFSGYFLWRPHRPRAARRWLLAVLVVGALFGFAQMARGAHFASHTLWSAWLCWTICVIGVGLSQRRARR